MKIVELSRLRKQALGQELADRVPAPGRRNGRGARGGPPESVKRILVVDDSLEARALEREILSHCGYSVGIAVDGVDGWYAVRTGNYDLVLADVDMPLVDGVELFRRIRADARLEPLPVLLVCDDDHDVDRRGLQAEASLYIVRDWVCDTLAQAVVSLIGPVYP